MQGFYTPYGHYRHRCHPLQRHNAGGNTWKHRHKIYSDNRPILRLHIWYNYHRHRITDSNQQFFLNTGFRDNIATALGYLQTTFSQVQVNNYTQLKADNYVKIRFILEVMSPTPAMEQIFSDLEHLKTHSGHSCREIVFLRPDFL